MKLLMISVMCLVPAIASADKIFEEAGKTETWDCAKDPVVDITGGSGTFTLTGACTTVGISASKVTIKIAQADTLNVNGSSCKVTIGTVGEINVNGASNAVTWDKAKSGTKPAVNANGTGNKIAKSAAAAPAKKAAPKK